MKGRSWIARAIYQCPEKVGLLLASSWLYWLQPVGDYCNYYPCCPYETISKN
ncbi:MAG: hypothetical protein QGG07_00825 [Dehalococcoidales bacterium]|nr:hypothetical protein [Dehalococcoidales bacterium]